MRNPKDTKSLFFRWLDHRMYVPITPAVNQKVERAETGFFSVTDITMYISKKNTKPIKVNALGNLAT